MKSFLYEIKKIIQICVKFNVMRKGMNIIFHLAVNVFLVEIKKKTKVIIQTIKNIFLILTLY